jgi:hypothetical protein
VKTIYALIFVTLLLSSTPFIAQEILYDNGPDPGNIYGWLVSDGYSACNSFALKVDSTIIAINISLYDVNIYNVPESLDWRILDKPRGNVIAYGTAANLRQIDARLNQFLFWQWLMQFEVPTLQLPAGTYWLEISNATNRWGTGVLWGENDGPSKAFFNGTFGGQWKHGGHDHGGSESFQILGFRR